MHLKHIGTTGPILCRHCCPGVCFSGIGILSDVDIYSKNGVLSSSW